MSRQGLHGCPQQVECNGFLAMQIHQQLHRCLHRGAGEYKALIGKVKKTIASFSSRDPYNPQSFTSTFIT